MNRGDFISKEFEAFFMERGIESTPQHIGLAGCGIQMAKHMLEAQKLKKLLSTEVVANAVYTLH
jgi:hypothetical protein